MVRPGGRWIVLGVGPGKTNRRAETASPVAGILAEKGAQLLNVNLLRYFAEPGVLDDAAKALLSRAIGAAAAGSVRPHIAARIPAEVEAINAAIDDTRAGRGNLGKVAVIVDKAGAR